VNSPNFPPLEIIKSIRKDRQKKGITETKLFTKEIKKFFMKIMKIKPEVLNDQQFADIP